MSSDGDGFRSQQHTLRARLVMAGAFVGGMIALALAIATPWLHDFSAQVSGEGASGPAPAPQAESALRSPPGSCLTWDRQDATDTRKVPCEQPHVFEITGVVSIADGHPPGSPPPSTAQWQQIAQQRCTPGAQQYLNKPLDPEGKLSVSALRPGDDQWANGDRTLRCGLQWAGPGGGLQRTTTPAAQLEQAAVWDPGTCLGLNGGSVGDPVPCTQPHAYEIIAVKDLSTEWKRTIPRPDEQMQWLDQQCAGAVKEYTGADDVRSKGDGLLLTWDTRSEQSWQAGSKLVNCKVAAKTPDGRALAPITGSIGKGQQGGPAQQPGR